MKKEERVKGMDKIGDECGIYVFTNLINGKQYVGQSRNIKRRVHSHLCSYKRKGDGMYDGPFYSALRKYGPQNFRVDILEICTAEELNSAESKWIKLLNTVSNGRAGGYNITHGGEAQAEPLHTEEAMQKCAEAIRKSPNGKDENHPGAKLTNIEVSIIRQRYIDGEDIEHLYCEFGFAYKSLVSFKQMVYGRRYRHVQPIPSPELIKARHIENIRGDKNTAAKLTDDEVIDIRKRYAAGEDLGEIFKDYRDVYASINVFKMVVFGRSFKNVGDIQLRDACVERHAREKNWDKSGENHSNATMCNVDAAEIRKAFLAGMLPAQIACKYPHVSKHIIDSILAGKKYKNAGSEVLVVACAKKWASEKELRKSGENNVKSSFSYKEVVKIRERYLGGEDKKHIYEDYRQRCTKDAFYNILKGRGYHAGDHQRLYIQCAELWKKQEGQIGGVHNYQSKFTEAEIKAIRKRYDSGERFGLIYDDFKDRCSRGALDKIVARKTYKNVI